LQRGHAARLFIAGEGPERGALGELAKVLGIWDRVEFVGGLDRIGVAHLLRESQVFVSGSWEEGISVALLEALSSGVPAVTTVAGACGGIVKGGVNGLIVEGGSKHAFALAIESVLANHCEMSPRARESVLQFDASIVAAQIRREIALAAALAGRERVVTA
jgi:glycosyltransferase involved in cell wall biosynthesis